MSDTINQQPADPYKAKNTDDEGVSLKTKVEDLLDFVHKTKFCMMTTREANSELLASRAMALAGEENHGLDLLFHTNTHSGKNADLGQHSTVNLSFINSTTGDWASLSGHATVSTDRDLIRKNYSPSLKAWLGDLGDGKHDGGPEDPRIGVIRVKVKTAQYAVQKRTMVGAMASVAKGAITGETASVNKLRHLSEEEVEQWRAQGEGA